MQPIISTCSLSVALLLFATSFSQAYNMTAFTLDSAASPPKKVFLRLYNHERQRIGNGYLLYGNDTMIMLSKRRSIRRYPVSSVTYIKTRRLGAGDIAIGAGVVTALVAVAWATRDWHDQTLVIPPFASSTGAPTRMIIKKKTIWIYRDIENWKAIRNLFFHP